MGNNTLLDDDAKKEMQRSQWIQTDGYDAGMEFGLGLEALAVGQRRLVGHSGHIAGHVTATYVDPYDGLAVSVAANSKDAPSPKIATSIVATLDYFATYGSEPTPPDLARFNARLYSPIATVEIIATAGKIIAIDPNDWQPFAFYEELACVDATTLQIITEGSIFNEAELVRYAFSQHAVASVRYAGGTLVPEKAYRQEWG
jgi:CubicO group peptidase (beta-lactamase class C family)